MFAICRGGVHIPGALHWNLREHSLSLPGVANYIRGIAAAETQTGSNDAEELGLCKGAD